jgi:hypothetical protein
MGVWRCKVSLRYGIRNNVGLYRCRLCGGDVFLSVSRHFRPEGEHAIAVEDLFAGYFETVLAKNEQSRGGQFLASSGSQFLASSGGQFQLEIHDDPTSEHYATCGPKEGGT